MTMWKSLKELIQDLVNFTLTLLIELETTFMFVSVSHQLVKSLEIDLENSQLSSMNAQSIGSYLGHKRHLFQSQNHLLKNSNS